MAITHFIDTSVPEIARARMKSQTQRVPEAFPVLVFGDTRNHNWVFMNQGTVEAFSGDPTYTLRITIGEVDLPPTNGSYKLTCGANTTGSLDALSDAVTVEAALNALAQIISDGGVKVTGTFPNFLITWVNVGVVTGLSGNASLLIPQSAITLTTLFTGSTSIVNQVSLQIRQAAITSQSTWSTISSPAAGWNGQLTTNTSGALTLLSNRGVAIGEFIEVSTVLTAEVLDPNGFPSSFYQTPITLRAKNLDPSNMVSNSIAYYNLGDLVYGNPAGTLSTLPGNNTTQRKFLTQAGDGTNSAKPNWNYITASDLPNSELPGAPNTSVQINIGGTFTGYPDFTYDPVNKVVSALRYTGTWTNGINASNVNTGILPAAQLPYPGATTLGGANSAAVATNKWIDSLGTNGVFRQTQPAINNISGISGSLLNFLGTPTSSNLAAAVSDETGTGNLVFATSPNLITPNIGAANGSALTINALTSTAILLGGGINPVTASDLTYVTPTLTVPDAFVVSSAGSIGLTAGGSNKNITISPGGTGIISFSNSTGAATLTPSTGSSVFQFIGADTKVALLEVNAFGSQARMRGRRANGTIASPTAVTINDVLFNFQGQGWVTSGGTQYSGGAGISLTATEPWTLSATGSQWAFTVIGNLKTTVRTALILDQAQRIIGTSDTQDRNLSAWGTANGAYAAFGGGTITDTSSSGTVASAVGVSFAVPAFAASSATTWTDGANVYIAGGPANGTNGTITNSYGLWNVGKTRLDGTAAAGALPSGATTVGTILTMPAQTFTVTGTNTATAFQASYHGAPTFTDASVGMITDAFNSVFVAPGAAGGSLVITRSHTLGVLDATSAVSSITGGLVVAATYGTTATSVGIGGGNINAGGTLITGGTIRANGGYLGSSGGVGLTQASTATLGKSITVENGLITAFA